MSPAEQVTVTTSAVRITETTITSTRLTVSFAVCTTDGATRWSVAVWSESLAASQRIERAIESLADASTSWSRRSPWEWSCNGAGWTEQHAALIELAEALARFGAEGRGDA